LLCTHMRIGIAWHARRTWGSLRDRTRRAHWLRGHAHRRRWEAVSYWRGSGGFSGACFGEIGVAKGFFGGDSLGRVKLEQGFEELKS
jgi:hypothetical protein